MRRSPRVAELEYLHEAIAFPDGPGSRPWRLLTAEAPARSQARTRLIFAKTVAPNHGYVALSVVAHEGQTFSGTAARVRMLLIPDPRVTARAVRSVFLRGRVTNVLSGECPAEFYGQPPVMTGSTATPRA